MRASSGWTQTSSHEAKTSSEQQQQLPQGPRAAPCALHNAASWLLTLRTLCTALPHWQSSVAAMHSYPLPLCRHMWAHIMRVCAAHCHCATVALTAVECTLHGGAHSHQLHGCGWEHSLQMNGILSPTAHDMLLATMHTCSIHQQRTRHYPEQHFCGSLAHPSC